MLMTLTARPITSQPIPLSWAQFPTKHRKWGMPLCNTAHVYVKYDLYVLLLIVLWLGLSTLSFGPVTSNFQTLSSPFPFIFCFITRKYQDDVCWAF